MLFLSIMKKIPILFLVGIALIGLFGPKVKAQSPADYQGYLRARQAMMQQDSQLYFDAGVQLDDQEQLLNQKLHQLQRQQLEQYKQTHFFPPARDFYQSKSHIENTQLFQLLRKMPKGGMLHLHTPAMGNVDWILEKAQSLPEMHVFWATPTDQYTKGQLRAFDKDKVPEGFVPVHELIGNEATYYQALRDLLVFGEEIDRDSVDIWQEFELVFQRIYGFVYYQPVFEDYIVHGLEILAEDNFQYAELRMGFKNSIYTIDSPPNYTNISSFVESLKSIKTRIKAIDPDFEFTIIHAGLRFKDATTIEKEMETAFAYRQKYPEWLRGFDLVAEEDAGNPTLFHAPQFLKLNTLDDEGGIELPLYLHDGESNWASVDNLYDAVLLGTKRIGHGFNLFRFPNLMEKVKEKNILLEINPLSNQILGYIRDLRNHPASTYLRRGIQCSISSDDPLIFDYEGISYDYWSIFLAWELDLASLKQLSKNGITFAAMTETEKATALSIWQRRWDQFVQEGLRLLD